ncbi:MAG: hypothetical protein AAGF20_01000 [Pseudomonadota bacterium]
MPTRRLVLPTSRQLVDENGAIVDEWFDFFEELIAGTSNRSLGTIVSGVNGILNGTAEVADIVIAGRGSLKSEQDAQQDTINQNAMDGAGLNVTVEPGYVLGSGAGNQQTSTTSITITGGVAPYTIAWATKSGDTFTAVSPTSLAADGSFNASFTGTAPEGGSLTGVQEITVTDSMVIAQVRKRSVSVSITNFAKKGELS